MPQAKLPAPGQNAYAFRVETHSKQYSLHGPKGGVIPSGYGAGTVEQVRSEPTEVLEADDRHVRFNLYSGQTPQQFFMKRMGDKRWLLRNITPTADQKKWQGLLGTGERPELKKLRISEWPVSRGQLQTYIDEHPKSVLQPKIDGAQVQVALEAGKPPRVFSYREAKNETGLIEHTHKLPEFWKEKTPAELGGTILRAEISGVDRHGKAVPARRIGGLLNSGVWKSRAEQEAKGIKLHLHTFLADRMGGRSAQGKDYGEQISFLKQVARKMPSLVAMPTARTQKEKEQLAESVLSGKHPLTREGLVGRDLETGKTVALKTRDPFDVYVREVVPGKAKGEAGAIKFSLTPRGKVVGNVGSGFSQALRRAMLKHPDQYVGRVAKVEAEDQFPSGALRMPVFREFHIEKGRPS